MGARKIDSSDGQRQQAVTKKPQAVQLTLRPESVLFTKNGVEFHSPTPFPLWTEMTVVLGPGPLEKEIQCNGIVVSCKGNRQTGYHVALLFLDVAPQAKAALAKLARASWAWI